MDSPALRKLTRAQLQTLAKQENLKANGKTEDIISRLIGKYPQGVPSSEKDASSKSKAKTRRRMIKAEGTSPIRLTPAGKINSKPKNNPGRKIKNASNVSPSRADVTETKIDMPADSDTTAPQLPSSPQQESLSGTALSDSQDQGLGPSLENTHLVKKELKKLVNDFPTIRTHITDTKFLVTKADEIIASINEDLKELFWTRTHIERDHVSHLKIDNSLWDGSGLNISKADDEEDLEENLAAPEEALSDEDSEDLPKSPRKRARDAENADDVESRVVKRTR